MKKPAKALTALLLALVLTVSVGTFGAWAENCRENKTVYVDGWAGEMVEVWDGEETQEIFMKYPDINQRYLYINRIWASRIKAAPENGSVQIKAAKWYSFNNFVGDAIAARPDVEVEFGFLNENEDRVSLKIPAGTDVLGLMDGKEVMQFQDLAEALGVDTPAFEELKP